MNGATRGWGSGRRGAHLDRSGDKREGRGVFAVQAAGITPRVNGTPHGPKQRAQAAA